HLYIYFSRFPALSSIFLFGLDQVEPQSVRILKSEVFFPEPFTDHIVGDIEFFKTGLPKTQAALGYGIADLCCHTGTVLPLPNIFPGEKGKDGSRTPSFVPEVEMVGLGIVKIDGFFDQTKSKGLGVEVVITLGIARYCGNMVQSQYLVFHGNNFFKAMKLSWAFVFPVRGFLDAHDNSMAIKLSLFYNLYFGIQSHFVANH